MPPAVIAAGIGAAGTVAGGLFSNAANRRSVNAQERASNNALGFERERLAQENTYRQQSMDDYRRRHSEWSARRDAVLRSQGIDIGGGRGETLGSMAGAPAGGGGGFTSGPMTLQSLAMPQAEDDTPQLDENGQPLAWNDWRAHGLR